MRKTAILLCVLSLFVLSSCNQEPSEKVTRYHENHEIIGSEKEELLSNLSETIFETSERSNITAEEAQVDVNYEVKEIVVAPGRYQIIRHASGTVSIQDLTGGLLYRGVLGSSYGVNSITVDLNNAHIIRVDGGQDTVYVQPVATQLSTELTAGIWEVGLDIEEGEYTVTAPNGVGYLQQFDPTKEPILFEVIGGNFASTTSKIQLRKGQKLKITGISMVQFLPL